MVKVLNHADPRHGARARLRALRPRPPQVKAKTTPVAQPVALDFSRSSPGLHTKLDNSSAGTVSESLVFGNGRPSFKLWKARSQLYRRRFSRPNTRWKALDEIYLASVYILLATSVFKFSQMFQRFRQNVDEMFFDNSSKSDK